MLLFITLFWWFSRYYFGKFLDKIFPFPLLREAGEYKYKNFQEDFTYQGQALYTGFSGVIIFIPMFLSFGLNWVGWVLLFYFFCLLSCFSLGFVLLMMIIFYLKLV